MQSHTRARRAALTLLAIGVAAAPAAALAQSSDTRAPVLRAALGRNLGHPYLVLRCDESCSVTVRIIRGGRTLARQRHNLRPGIPANEKLTVPVRDFRGASTLKVTLKVRATDKAGNASRTKTLRTTLKR